MESPFASAAAHSFGKQPFGTFFKPLIMIKGFNLTPLAKAVSTTVNRSFSLPVVRNLIVFRPLKSHVSAIGYSNQKGDSSMFPIVCRGCLMFASFMNDFAASAAFAGIPWPWVVARQETRSFCLKKTRKPATRRLKHLLIIVQVCRHLFGSLADGLAMAIMALLSFMLDPCEQLLFQVRELHCPGVVQMDVPTRHVEFLSALGYISLQFFQTNTVGSYRFCR